jgi:hypothetical protein
MTAGAQGQFLPGCDCFDTGGGPLSRESRFHAEQQDTRCDAWRRLLDAIAAAAADEKEEFSMPVGLDQEGEIVTLPPEIGRLKSVKRLILTATWLVRLPPEIGDMESLERLDVYMCHRLHWLPYEITRCRKLKDSAASTRALYGNYKFRHPFPRLQPGGVPASGQDLRHLAPEVFGADSATTCSVCGNPLAGHDLRQVWLSRLVATDVMPLLVNACSEACIRALPPGEDGYVPTPHAGGLEVQQPLSQLHQSFDPDGRLTAKAKAPKS